MSLPAKRSAVVTCAYCNASRIRERMGRPPTYCSPKCRLYAWRSKK